MDHEVLMARGLTCPEMGLRPGGWAADCTDVTGRSTPWGAVRLGDGWGWISRRQRASHACSCRLGSSTEDQSIGWHHDEEETGVRGEQGRLAQEPLPTPHQPSA